MLKQIGLTYAQVFTPIGTRHTIPVSGHHEHSYNVTLILSLSDDPVFVNIKRNTNNQYDFLAFVAEACERNILGEGDYLILDNAQIHKARSTRDAMLQLENSYGFKLVFLPTYSPELNPCELVFNKVKHYMRYHKDPSLSFLQNILLGFSKISSTNTLGFYLKTLVFESDIDVSDMCDIYNRANV